MRLSILTTLLILLIGINGFSQKEKQNTPPLLAKKIRKIRPTFIGLSMGINHVYLRDFATSPLGYTGNPLHTSFSRIRIDSSRESKLGLSFSYGNLQNDFNQHTATSNVSILSLYYSQLYKINKLSSKKINIKVGGLFNTTANLRINPYFVNNSVGYEIIPTLFGSMKLTKDLSSKKKNKTRNLSFRLNVGLINNTYRNGYIYTTHSGVLNQDNAFDGYQFKVFSGFRMSSALDYTIFLKNKNRLQLSYLWDAYKTGGDLDKFEMASHTIKLSLLFNTNNK